MRKIILLYNPHSGRRPARREADIEAAANAFKGAGIEVICAATYGASATTMQVREAIANGCEAVFACGGDGTIHDVIQGLAGTTTPLGIIPLGTANALAHDLGIPFSSSMAAKAALQSKLKRIALGSVQYRDLNGDPATRLFTVATGIGINARLFYALKVGMKTRFGMAAYYLKAWHLWLNHKTEQFIATSDSLPTPCLLTDLLAVRICNFGGVLRELAPGASLDRNDFRLVGFQTKSRLPYLLYIVRTICGARWRVRRVQEISCVVVSCDYPASHDPRNKIYVEADGELLGTLPVRITMVPDSLTVLVPR